MVGSRDGRVTTVYTSDKPSKVQNNPTITTKYDASNLSNHNRFWPQQGGQRRLFLVKADPDPPIDLCIKLSPKVYKSNQTLERTVF